MVKHTKKDKYDDDDDESKHYAPKIFHNVKLKLDFVEIWSFYRDSDFTWNQILTNSNAFKRSKILFLAILEVQYFDL